MADKFVLPHNTCAALTDKEMALWYEEDAFQEQQNCARPVIN